LFSRRRGDSRATTCRPLIATALLTPSSVLEDNLLNSSADPRKAPNEIISLDHLIRAHTTAGSFVCNRKRHVPHPQTHIFIILYTNMNFHIHTYTHPHTCKRPSTIDFWYDIRIIIIMYEVLLVSRTGPFHTFRPSFDRHSLYILCVCVCVCARCKQNDCIKPWHAPLHNAARCFN